MSKPSTAAQPQREEPEITREESVPSDGRDLEGEQLMKKVDNPKLHDKGEAEHKTPEKADTSAGKRGGEAASD